MLSGIAVSSPRLSRNTYLHGAVFGLAAVQLQSGTMWMPVVLTARIGVFRLSARGCTATAEFESVGPSRARSCDDWISVCAFWAEVAASEASSCTSRSIIAPLTPPAALICLTASMAPSRLWGPYTPPAPVTENPAPNLIFLPAYEFRELWPPPVPVEPQPAITNAATNPQTRRMRFISISPSELLSFSLT